MILAQEKKFDVITLIKDDIDRKPVDTPKGLRFEEIKDEKIEIKASVTIEGCQDKV